MKLFSHKYKNMGQLQKFCEENLQERPFACALAIVTYKSDSQKEAEAVCELIQKNNKKVIVISFALEAECLNERLLSKGVLVTLLLSAKATIKAKAVESSKITEGFLADNKSKELKAAIVFSSIPHLPPPQLYTELASINAKIVGLKPYSDDSRATIKLNGKEIKNGVVIVTLSGKNLNASIYDNSQIKPISKKLKVTSAKNGFVYEIEGLKLLEAYKKLLGEDIVMEDPLLAACRFPLISQESGKALFIDEFNSHKAVMHGEIKEGDMLQIGYSSPKNMGLKSYESAKASMDEPPSAMLIFSDYTLKKFFKNKTPLAIPGSLSSVCDCVSYFGGSEIYGENGEIPCEYNHSSIVLALSEKDDDNTSNLKETKVPATPADAFVNLVDDALKEQFEINAKLKKALSTQKIFISSISHDIRTPLNSIIGFLDLLECTDLDTEQQGYVHKSLVSSKHLLRLISDVLDVSKIEAEQMEFFESPFDYGLLLDDIKNIVSSRCDNKVALEFGDPMLERYIIGDADRLKQILVNLISNSLKFTKQGFVKVNTTVKNRRKHKLELEITVKDTGIGIEKTKLTEIFKPFYQTRETESKNFGGTGLGLYICKNICEIMGGSIRCESEFGKGSKFFVNLPLKMGDAIAKNQGTLEFKYDFASANTKELRLLIVEDVVFNAELISAMLNKKFGIQNIKFAKDGLEALEIIKKESFDIVFMDVQMPRLDGFSTIRLIREFDKTTPIVVMSANAFKEDVEKALKLGANDYVTKPIRTDKVAEVLSKYALRQKIEIAKPEPKTAEQEHTKINMQRQIFAYYKNNLGLTGKDAKTLYGVCIDSIKKTLSKADDAISTGDFKELYGTIHNLKGILASTGLDELLHATNTLNTQAKKSAESGEAPSSEFHESFTQLKKALFMLYGE